MARIALIDLSAIARMHWHASEDVEVSEASRKTLSQVVTSAAGYDHVAVCVDRPPYLRAKIDASYKATREKTASAYYDQLRRVEEQLDADGYHVLGAEGYEADDVIATLVAAHAGEHALTIYSADKDLMALVGESVCQISTGTGQKYDAAAVKAKFGVGPELIPDLLALTGDTSDNIHGIKGCGTKTAAKWLTEIGPLDVILQNVDKLPERFRSLVADNTEQLGLAWRLVTLMTDAPIDTASILQPKDKRPAATATADPEPEIIDAPAPPVAQPTALVRAPAHLEPVAFERSLEPRDSTSAFKLAQILFASRLFGQFPNAEAILAVILTGRAFGLDANASLRGCHIIKGRVTMSAQFMVGLVKRSHECEWFRLVESTAEKATWETKRRDEPSPTSMTYTIEQAKRAGLLRPTRSGEPSQWDLRPDTMLRWRAATELARAVYPDVVSGLISSEEAEDV